MPHEKTNAYRLTHELGHFTGERWPAGTEVEVRPYAADPTYFELRTPDGFWLTVTELDFEAIPVAETGGVEITDPTLDESGRFEVSPDYHEQRASVELTLTELMMLELVLIDAKTSWDSRNHGAHTVHRRAISTARTRISNAYADLAAREEELLAGGAR